MSPVYRQAYSEPNTDKKMSKPSLGIVKRIHSTTRYETCVIS